MRQAALILCLLVIAFLAGHAFQGPGMGWVMQKVRGGPSIQQLSLKQPDQSVHPTSSDGISQTPSPSRHGSSRVGSSPAAEEIPEAPRVPLDELLGKMTNSRAKGANSPGTKPQSPATVSDQPAPRTERVPSAWGEATASARKVEPSVAPRTTREVEERWAKLESRMRELGISRFQIEGEPGGMMRFSCTLPMIEPAVGCQFEAEAEDILTAAETALRRAGIWRATESLPGTYTAAQTR